MLETLVLSVLNYDTAVATAAARMVSAAEGRPLAEMGSRRTGERSGVAAARAAYIAGFGATSNLEAGRTWGVPTMGTAAHAFTLLHDTEEEAFRAQVAAMGAGTTLLVDTYDIPTAIETAVRVAGTGARRRPDRLRRPAGRGPRGARPARLARCDRARRSRSRTTSTSTPSRHCVRLPVDSYGVGTSVVTGSGAPATGMVYKLVAHQARTGSGSRSRRSRPTRSRSPDASIPFARSSTASPPRRPCTSRAPRRPGPVACCRCR